MSFICMVSIRASLQQRGERVLLWEHFYSDKFQSAPHFSSEANGVILWEHFYSDKFQSAPHFSSEANKHERGKLGSGFQVSIRASLQQRGELDRRERK